MTARPAPAPCGSCPYRLDVPSGVWDESEYRKLPPYDRDTAYQPSGVFYCHQQDGRICAGWAGTHDMDNNLALRLVSAREQISEEDVVATLDYTTDVPLFESGTEACEHGLADIEAPGERAVKVGAKLRSRRRS